MLLVCPLPLVDCEIVLLLISVGVVCRVVKIVLHICIKLQPTASALHSTPLRSVCTVFVSWCNADVILLCYWAASHAHTHTRLTALCPGLPGWSSSRKVKPFWILLKQETVSGSGISWAICKSAPRSRQTPAPHHSVFYRLDALPAAQPTASKHWR